MAADDMLKQDLRWIDYTFQDASYPTYECMRDLLVD